MRRIPIVNRFIVQTIEKKKQEKHQKGFNSPGLIPYLNQFLFSLTFSPVENGESLI